MAHMRFLQYAEVRRYDCLCGYKRSEGEAQGKKDETKMNKYKRPLTELRSMTEGTHVRKISYREEEQKAVEIDSINLMRCLQSKSALKSYCRQN